MPQHNSSFKSASPPRQHNSAFSYGKPHVALTSLPAGREERRRGRAVRQRDGRGRRERRGRRGGRGREQVEEEAGLPAGVVAGATVGGVFGAEAV